MTEDANEADRERTDGPLMLLPGGRLGLNPRKEKKKATGYKEGDHV
jgi:hypothetical protein